MKESLDLKLLCAVLTTVLRKNFGQNSIGGLYKRVSTHLR